MEEYSDLDADALKKKANDVGRERMSCTRGNDPSIFTEENYVGGGMYTCPEGDHLHEGPIPEGDREKLEDLVFNV